VSPGRLGSERAKLAVRRSQIRWSDSFSIREIRVIRG
jgi:hypothetical protein